MTKTNLAAFLGPPQVVRWNKASYIKKLKDIDLPELSVWNYGPCDYHETPTPECQYQACGGEPFKHQKKTAVFSYTTERSLVANSTGTGKTISALLTLAIAHHYGEEIRALVVVPTTAVHQWYSETRRWTPGFTAACIPSKTPEAERLATYARKWNVLIVGYHAFQRDEKYFPKVPIRQVIVDDVDPSLNTQNETYKALKKVCDRSKLTIVQNATSLQMNLLQLYAASSLIGGNDVWGSKTSFTRTYVKKGPVYVKTKKGPKRVFKAIGYQNMKLFKKKFDPMSIRITYEDIVDDVTIPDLMTEQVYFDLSKKQRIRYAELQQGVRTILNATTLTTSQKSIGALAAFTIGSQICSGLFSLKTSDGGYEPDSDDASPKLDWIMGKLKDEWSDEKVVVYAKFRGAIRAIQDRLDNEGIGHATIWGVVTDPEERKAEMDRFWTDPDCKVMIISVSGERSLNLQNASILVMWDLQLNPARVSQLAGRVRRLGSKHKRVFVFELLHSDTQEERYMAALAARQTLFDYVYDVDDSNVDSDNLLIEKLDPDQVLRLIQP